MIVTTATGKQFESDYAVDNPRIGIAFVRILDQDLKTVERLLGNEDELPLDCFPQYKSVDGIFSEQTAVKIMLKP